MSFANKLVPLAQRSGIGEYFLYELIYQYLSNILVHDSDRYGADDELGRVEVDLYGESDRYSHCGDRNLNIFAFPEDLHRHSGKMRYHKSHLKHSIREKKSMPGEIHFSIGYFPKVKPDGERQQHSNKDSNIPEDFQRDPEMRKESPKTMDKEEDRIIAMIPSDKYPSGILSIRESTSLFRWAQIAQPNFATCNRGPRSFRPATTVHRTVTRWGQE